MSLISDCGKAIYKEFEEVTEAKTIREPKSIQERKCQESSNGVLVGCLHA